MSRAPAPIVNAGCWRILGLIPAGSERRIDAPNRNAAHHRPANERRARSLSVAHRRRTLVQSQRLVVEINSAESHVRREPRRAIGCRGGPLRAAGANMSTRSTCRDRRLQRSSRRKSARPMASGSPPAWTPRIRHCSQLRDEAATGTEASPYVGEDDTSHPVPLNRTVQIATRGIPPRSADDAIDARPRRAQAEVKTKPPVRTANEFHPRQRTFVRPSQTSPSWLDKYHRTLVVRRKRTVSSLNATPSLRVRRKPDVHRASRRPT